MVSIQNLLTVSLRRNDRGATRVALGAAVVITAVTSIGTNLDTAFSNVANTT